MSRQALYNWKSDLMGKGESITMPKEKGDSLFEDRKTLLSEVEGLKKKIRRLKMEVDVWEKAAEIIKKTRASP